jgi:hypothetical protein
MDGGGEAVIGFVVTCRDALELLEPLEAVLDEMSQFVQLGVVRNVGFAVRLGRYDGNRTALVQLGAQLTVVEGFVGDKRLQVDVLDQRLGADAVMALTRQEHKTSEIAERIDQRHNLGRQPAARVAMA